MIWWFDDDDDDDASRSQSLSLSNKQTNKQSKLNILHYRAREEHQSRGEKEQKVYNNTILPILCEKKSVVLPLLSSFSFFQNGTGDLARIVVVWAARKKDAALIIDR